MPDHHEPLAESGADPDPFGQFGRWFADAAAVVSMPEAVALATADHDGRPSARMVLMKAWDRRGFTFHTNYESRKGRELADNPWAAMLFYWDPLGRQVRVEGRVARSTEAESDAYFATRPPGAQLGALASRQSQPIESRQALDRRVREVTAEHRGSPVERPAWWGGFRLTPTVFEFWQNRDDRLHDRLRYVAEGDRWRMDRLQP